MDLFCENIRQDTNSDISIYKIPTKLKISPGFSDIFTGTAYAPVSDISAKICCLTKAGEKSAALKKAVCFFPSA